VNRPRVYLRPFRLSHTALAGSRPSFRIRRPAGARAADSVFVLLDFLEGCADQVTKTHLRHFSREPPHPDVASYDDVSFIRPLLAKLETEARYGELCRLNRLKVNDLLNVSGYVCEFRPARDIIPPFGGTLVFSFCP